MYGRFGLNGFAGGQSAGKLITNVFHKKSKVSTSETAYLVSNFRFGEVMALDVLKFKRDHWGIENYLHRVRDVEMGEDAHHMRTEDVPEILAVLSNAVIAVLHLGGYSSVRAAAELFRSKPVLAFRLLSG